MKLKKVFAASMAALVVATSIPAAGMTTFAKDSATSATPKQEVEVKKPANVEIQATETSVAVVIPQNDKKADGYQIQYSTSKKFSKKTTKKQNVKKKGKKTTVNVENLEEGTTYYIRVRTYTIDKNGKKVYSGWTKVKQTQTK